MMVLPIISSLNKGFDLRKRDQDSSKSTIFCTIYLENKSTNCRSFFNIVDLLSPEQNGNFKQTSLNKIARYQGVQPDNNLYELQVLIENLSKKENEVSYMANNLTQLLKDSFGGYKIYCVGQISAQAHRYLENLLRFTNKRASTSISTKFITLAK